MPIKLRKCYFINVRERYQKATKRQKTRILSEFCVNGGYSRKHASRILKGVVQPRTKRPGPKTRYDDDVLVHLRTLWELTGRLCGKNFKVAIPLWLNKSKEHVPEAIKKKMLTISAATIDRMLAPYRRVKSKGISTTRASLLKHKIPVRTLDAKALCPGIVNADTVAHCGDNASGDFMNSLTVVDLFSGWTLNKAIWKKDASATLKQIKKVESELPFMLVEFFSDNGNEFINHDLQNYFEKRPGPVNYRRTRA